MKKHETKMSSTDPKLTVWNPLEGITPEQIAEADAETEAAALAQTEGATVPVIFPVGD